MNGSVPPLSAIIITLAVVSDARAPMRQSTGPTLASLLLAGAGNAVADFQRSAMAAGTIRAYGGDWDHFVRWCSAQNVTPLPATPETTAAYLAASATITDPQGKWVYAPSTLGRRLAAVNKAHGLAGFGSPGKHPVVSTTLAGIRRERLRPVRRMAPLLVADLRAVLEPIDVTGYPGAVIGRRDCALLVMGFAGAFRRSELVALTTGDVTMHPEDGLHIRMVRSKTDQEGRGALRALPFGTHRSTCAPCAYLLWRLLLDAFDGGGRAAGLRELLHVPGGSRADLPAGHICRGVIPTNTDLSPDRPLFRPVHKSGIPGAVALTGHGVNSAIKKRVAVAGFDPTDFGGHSLRAGFVTQAVRAGADASSIMRQTGHKSASMVEVYRRENAPLMGNAVTRIGL